MDEYRMRKMSKAAIWIAAKDIVKSVGNAKTAAQHRAYSPDLQNRFSPVVPNSVLYYGWVRVCPPFPITLYAYLSSVPLVIDRRKHDISR